MRMDFRQFIEDTEGLGVLGIRVTADGEESEWLFEPDIRRNVYSAGKSFVSAAVGFAIEEGLLSLEEKLTDAFAGDLPEEPSENLKKATVRDTLTMCLGQRRAFLMAEERTCLKEKDWVRYALAQPFEDTPGTRFVYSNVGAYLAGVLIQERAGCDLLTYLEPRLLEPLEIGKTVWEVDPLGRTFGASGLFLSLRELHRFGMLYLQKGQWNGRQILPSGWVEESTRKQVDNGKEGYGYLFWRERENAYLADGKFCQWTLVLPNRNAVISLTGEVRDHKNLKKILYRDIVSQLKTC